LVWEREGTNVADREETAIEIETSSLKLKDCVVKTNYPLVLFDFLFFF
jgi:hypothetical protein